MFDFVWSKWSKWSKTFKKSHYLGYFNIGDGPGGPDGPGENKLFLKGGICLQLEKMRSTDSLFYWLDEC